MGVSADLADPFHLCQRHAYRIFLGGVDLAVASFRLVDQRRRSLVRLTEADAPLGNSLIDAVGDLFDPRRIDPLGDR